MLAQRGIPDVGNAWCEAADKEHHSWQDSFGCEAHEDYCLTSDYHCNYEANGAPGL